MTSPNCSTATSACSPAGCNSKNTNEPHRDSKKGGRPTCPVSSAPTSAKPATGPPGRTASTRRPAPRSTPSTPPAPPAHAAASGNSAARTSRHHQHLRRGAGQRDHRDQGTGGQVAADQHPARRDPVHQRGQQRPAEQVRHERHREGQRRQQRRGRALRPAPSPPGTLGCRRAPRPATTRPAPGIRQHPARRGTYRRPSSGS
jgi:hypothetical protein